MDAKTQNVSEFAQVLRRLLDDTGMFKRNQWAELLNVSEAAISQWVTDNTVPRAELLRMVVDLVRARGRAPRELLQEFEAVAAKPGTSVSPKWKERFGDSVNTYLVRPLLEGFLLDLKGLKADAQERVLLKSTALCAEESGFRRPQMEASAPQPALTAEVESRGGYQPKTPESPEATLAAIVEKRPWFLTKVMGYLTTTPSESLLPAVRTYCLQAIARVHANLNNDPKRLLGSIIDPRVLEPSLFDRITQIDALIAVFLFDDMITILVEEPPGSGKFVPLSQVCDVEEDFDEAVRTAIGRDVLLKRKKVGVIINPANVEEVTDRAA